MKRLYLLAAAGLAALAGCTDDPTSLTPKVSPDVPGPGFSVAVTPIGGGATANDLAQSLAGSGVTVQNVTYTGASAAAGTYSGGAGNVGFDGIVLSSGIAAQAAGPNSALKRNASNGTPGDADITATIGVSTFDAASLSFEIVADADSAFFEYVFASDEYPQFVGGPFVDGFVLLVNGQNCAVVGSPPVPITINTINAGSNASFFRANYPVPGTIDIAADGLTTTLVCKAAITPNVPNTVKLAIADGADRSVDSWVFIKAGSFSTTNPDAPANAPPELDSIANKQVVEASLLSFTASATDADAGQTLTYSLVGAPAGAGIDSATGAFSWTPVDDNPSGTTFDDYTFTVRVTDDGGASDEQAVTVRVFNDDPDITAVTGPTGPIGLSGGGATAHFTVSFADPGTADTHTVEADCGNSTVASSPTLAPGVSSGAVDCTYTAAGVYTVLLTASDDDSGFDSRVFQYVVVYDPGAGFVTGGGWITSPAGAYAANPTLTGKANFGFNARYKNGAQVPDGQTQFHFQAAGFNFHSTAYEWLVVAGARAQYKGTGTINGSGSYSFLLTVIDGQRPGGGGVDRFRLKVWGPGGVVYDNQMGDPDDGAASTALGGGSIVIHPN